jgi:uncharacterized membrane protein YhhN
MIVTVALLIRSESQPVRPRVRIWKPFSSLLMISVAALAWLRPHSDPAYTSWILAALVLSTVGDVALMFGSPRAFLAGLVAFLLAHIVYSTAFTLWNGLQSADWVTGAVLLVLGSWLYRYVLPGLGRLRLPVALYIVVICVMLNRAFSTLWGDAFSPIQRWMIAIGALFFWISDLMLGLNRFGRPFSWNRISLAFYYAGQALLALSASYFVA